MSSRAPALRPKQQAFVAEYLVDKNATKAAERAGYSPRSAYSIGQENLKKPEVRAAIDRELSAALAKGRVDREWVVARLVEIVDYAMPAAPTSRRVGQADRERVHRGRLAVRALELLEKMFPAPPVMIPWNDLSPEELREIEEGRLPRRLRGLAHG